jgi:hypothetical protein
MPALIKFFLLLLAAAQARASEGAFLASLAGSWVGGGTYVRPTSGNQINVRCELSSVAAGDSLTVKGSCRALLVIEPPLEAKVSATGDRYDGEYLGPEGRGCLQGNRSGNLLRLMVRWDQLVRGDYTSEMIIEKSSENSIRMRTIDSGPESGSPVATTDIRLQRK